MIISRRANGKTRSGVHVHEANPRSIVFTRSTTPQRRLSHVAAPLGRCSDLKEKAKTRGKASSSFLRFLLQRADVTWSRRHSVAPNSRSRSLLPHRQVPTLAFARDVRSLACIKSHPSSRLITLRSLIMVTNDAAPHRARVDEARV